MGPVQYLHAAMGVDGAGIDGFGCPIRSKKTTKGAKHVFKMRLRPSCNAGAVSRVWDGAAEVMVKEPSPQSSPWVQGEQERRGTGEGLCNYKLCDGL